MLDSHKRDINYLRVSITDRCNLRCVYCMPKKGMSLLGHRDILSYEEILRIVRVAVNNGIAKVRVTGGEPLVRRDIIEFTAVLKGIAGLNDISMTTNGILLEQFARPLYESGITRINVSLDSLDPEKYRTITRRGDLSRVLRGLAQAEQVGFSPIKINVVAIDGFNDDEVLDFAKMTLEKPYQVRFIEYMPIGETSLGTGFGSLSNDVIMEQINRVMPINPLREHGKTDGPAQRYRIKGAAGTIGFISAITHQFCQTCNRLRLTSDGKLRACLFVDNEVDIKSPLRHGCTDSELEEIVKYVIMTKPLRGGIGCHKSDRKHCSRIMSAIGG